MRTFLISLIACVLVASSLAFTASSGSRFAVSRKTSLNGFMGDPERPKLTRDSEPEEFFATDMDKMSDEEKIPIALAGLAFVSLPFIAGLIALYAAK
mmetsp:Transcript_11766/g.15352  ORF Transcript_11766/g.15352 Transcript_11766/m.15352 type:complete len:97 (+) Transcript_11766:110-400(+)